MPGQDQCRDGGAAGGHAALLPGGDVAAGDRRPRHPGLHDDLRGPGDHPAHPAAAPRPGGHPHRRAGRGLQPARGHEAVPGGGLPA